jgi:anthranilate phosphoribosyltransferase
MEKIKMLEKNNPICEVLYRINTNTPIDTDLLKEAFYLSLTNENFSFQDTQMSAILTGLMARGPTVEEVCALTETALSLDNFDIHKKIKIELPNKSLLVGAIGSGKKGVKTMNISTPSCLTATAGGSYTTKPVSSSTSSLTGSADFLRGIGVNIDLPIQRSIEILKKTGFGAFCIESLFPNFNKKYGGKFYVPHALSFSLPALVCPIEYDSQLYGLAHPNIELSAKVLKKLNLKNILIVTCTHDKIHYLDEIGVYGTTKLIGIKEGNLGDIYYFRPTEELGLPKYSPEDIIQGESVQENIKLSMDVLSGKGDKAREDIICINTGNLFYLSKKAEDYKEGYWLAKKAIHSKKVIDKLVEIVEESDGDKRKLFSYLK